MEEEERIKSAFEIAMERIAGLPRLTPEEIAAQKQREFRPIGEALAQKYLGGLISSDDLPFELEKYQGEQRQIVRRSLVESLCRSLGPDEPVAALAALAGMKSLAKGKAGFFEQAEEDLRQMIGQFEREKGEKAREFAVVAKRRLESFGISGSAVRPNLDQDENYQRELARIRQTYEPKVADLKNRLVREID